MQFERSTSRSRWLDPRVWLLTAVMAGPPIAQAGERCFVLRDGRKIGLTKSTDELGVHFRDLNEVNACAERLRSTGQGLLKDIPTAPNARTKILKTSNPSMSTRAQVRRDPAVIDARPVYRFDGFDDPAVSTGQLLVRLRASVTENERAEIWRHYRVTEMRAVEGLKNLYCLEPFDTDGDEVLTAELLAGDARVVWAQPNFRRVMRTRQSGVVDQYYTQQWHLNNTGQSLGTLDADIDAPEAWLVSEGQDVLIGVLDDSVDVDHEDLRDAYTGEGQDVTLVFQGGATEDELNDPRPKQFFDRHGTAVAGLALARANAAGVRGVAYLARFTASRFGQELLTADEVASAFIFARQENVDVHINSWGRPGANESAIEDAIRIAFTEGRPLGENQPKRGMVVVFASGNDGVENAIGSDYSTLSEVIGVGASNDDDERASYSNYGANINILAPSGDDFHGALLTTDNTDDSGYVDEGYNVGGFNSESGLGDLDSRGRYTDSFSGTSAACPVAAGVAALILSKNPLLTASDVKLILEHTCDRIDPAAAGYNGITSRSVRYGYGRVNAKRAVDAANVSLTNGNRTWPGTPFNVAVSDNEITWQASSGTEEFLLVESAAPFSFVPVDGACYDPRQVGCMSAAMTALPAGVTLTADPEASDCEGTCTVGTARFAEFLAPAGIKYFGLYARSNIGRYSFGVGIDSQGEITDDGPTVTDPDDDDEPGGGGGGGGPTDQPPLVTIMVSPLEGTSPLTVRFMGNAVSSSPIDDAQTQWDFDINALDDPISRTRNATYTYELAPGESERTFVARLTMFDTQGRPGSAQVMIRVRPASGGGGATGGDGDDLRIIVALPGTVDSDVDTGRSPFEVELKVDATSIVGTLLSVSWDLGDGNTATSINVPHTYVNTSSSSQVFPVTASVTTTVGSTTITTTASRLITVQPGDLPADPTDTECLLPGTCASGGRNPACTAGFIPMFGLALSLLLMRRRRC